MDAVVSVDVFQERVQLLFHKQPNDLDVAMIGRPMQGSMATSLRRVRYRLKVVDLFFIITRLAFVVRDFLIFVLHVRLMFNQQAHYVFVSVTCSPEQRVPTVLFAGGVCSDSKGFLDPIKVVFLDSSEQELVSLLLRHLLLLLLGARVVVATIAFWFNHGVVWYFFYQS
jgi:hypothetical protein